jgi:hypothetical protein
MATNRRRDQESAGLGVVIRALLLCGILAALGIGYVRKHSEQLELGRRITELEKRRERLERTLEAQVATLSTLVSRPQLLERVRHHGLNLAPAMPSQRMTVELPVHRWVQGGTNAGGSAVARRVSPVALMGGRP